MEFPTTRIDRNRRLVIWLFVFSLGLSGATSHASTPMEQEFQRVRLANNSMIQLVEARLDQEKFYLEQIRALREKGYASWLEQAKQQVAVDKLASQIDALRTFGSFVAQLETQVDRKTVDSDKDAGPEEFCAPVKVFLPGSMRLIGWIEPELATSTDQSQFIDEKEKEAIAVTHGKAIQLAEERFDRAGKQAQAFAEKADSTPDGWIRQAELQLKLAQAELVFVHLQRDLYSTQAAFTTDFQLDVQAERPDLVTAAENADLQLATYRVAWLEANAKGRLKTAEIEWLRHQQRLAAIERLRDEGFATANEVKQSRDLIETSELSMGQERERLKILKRICAAIEDSGNFTAVELQQGFDARLNVDSQWPKQILENRARLNHLIDLRRHYYDLQAQRAGTHRELELRRACAAKLQQAVAASTVSKSVSRAIAGELSATLVAGEKRELESLRLTIEHLAAQLQDCDEQMSILALEEKRFIAQCLRQDHGGDTSFVAVFHSNQPANKSRFSYLESRELDLYDGIMHVCAEPRYLQFTFDQRPYLPVNLSAPLTSSSARRMESRTEQQMLSRSSLEQRPMQRGPLRTGSGPDSVAPIYTGGSGSYDNYPNGILRAELRRQAPVGQIPWYLPGSPNNFSGD